MRAMRRRNNKGFTLLEIVFALAILTIGIVGVLAVFPVGLRASKRSGDFTMAAILAQRQMATIRKAGQAVYNPYDGNWPSYEEPFNDPHHPHFTKWHVVFTQPTLGIANLYTVDLKIYWLDRGAVRSEVFTTYLANRH